MGDKIVLLVLSNGEHLIGGFQGESDAGIVLEHPVSIVPDPQRQGNMLFIPYLQFSVEEKCVFPHKDIRHKLEPIPDLMKSYRERFGSGIVVPNQGLDLVT